MLAKIDNAIITYTMTFTFMQLVQFPSERSVVWCSCKPDYLILPHVTTEDGDTRARCVEKFRPVHEKLGQAGVRSYKVIVVQKHADEDAEDA